MSGGRALTATPDEVVSAKPVRCTHCQATLGEANHVLHGRYDKIDLTQGRAGGDEYATDDPG
jgi:hypothetical protein